MIRCEGLVREYGNSYRALDGVSLEIGRGEFVAVMGPSGCGKSTLLNILGLLDRPTKGRYCFDGSDVSNRSDKERTLLRRVGIGFVFQAFNLLPRLSAMENVCLPMAYAGLPKDDRERRARELLDRVGLGRKAQHSPLELSGGERQRVGIARALANRPPVLLADEPTGNLDSHSSAEVLKFLKELHAEGLTLLLVTHDSGIAAAAQRIIRLKDGKVC